MCDAALSNTYSSPYCDEAISDLCSLLRSLKNDRTGLASPFPEVLTETSCRGFYFPRVGGIIAVCYQLPLSAAADTKRLAADGGDIPSRSVKLPFRKQGEFSVPDRIDMKAVKCSDSGFDSVLNCPVTIELISSGPLNGDNRCAKVRKTKATGQKNLQINLLSPTILASFGLSPNRNPCSLGCISDCAGFGSSHGEVCSLLFLGSNCRENHKTHGCSRELPCEAEATMPFQLEEPISFLTDTIVSEKDPERLRALGKELIRLLWLKKNPITNDDEAQAVDGGKSAK